LPATEIRYSSYNVNHFVAMALLVLGFGA